VEPENRWQGQADVPLSEAGCEQARRLAQRLRAEGRRVRAIYASDLERALHTAEILARYWGWPIAEMGWREMNMAPGVVSPPLKSSPATPLSGNACVPGKICRAWGETFAQFQGRILRSIERLLEKHADEQVVIVTHGGAVRAFLLHCRGLDVSQFRQIDKMGTLASAR